MRFFETLITSTKQKISDSVVCALRYLQSGKPPAHAPEQIAFEGHLNGIQFFLGTKTGLMYFDGQALWRLFGGRVYGITRHNKRWYATWNSPIRIGGKKISQSGTIVSFYFCDEKIQHLRIEAAPLNQEIHQIDAWNNNLYVTDTANNRVIEYKIKNGKLTQKNLHYPNGKIKKGKKSSNYAHINSIFRKKEFIYLMFHNHTKYTGKKSQIAVINREWEVVDIINIDAESAHNIFKSEGNIVYCDSQNGRLVRNSDTLFEKNVYIRGLAVSKYWWLVGGSEFADREERGSTNGYVYKWNKYSEKIESSIRIPNSGSIYEIRLKSKKDYGMSNSGIINESK